MLLLSTLGGPGSRPSALLQHLNIRLFYRANYVLSTLSMGLLFLVFEASRLAAAGPVLWTAALALLAASAGHRRVVLAQERVEHLLDEVLRLATSEPVLHALLGSREHVPFLFGMTEPVLLPGGGTAAGRRIEDLDIRRKTGASIIAIYRKGRHLTNPQPGLELLADDVVVLYGEPSVRQRAVELLLGG